MRIPVPLDERVTYHYHGRTRIGWLFGLPTLRRCTRLRRLVQAVLRSVL